MLFDVKTLELDKIIERVLNYGHTELGKKQIQAITPTTDQKTILFDLSEVEDAKKMVKEGLDPRFGGIYNLDKALKRAAIEGVLEISDFLNIISHIDAVKYMKKDLLRYQSVMQESLAIEQYADQLASLPELKKAIDTVIDTEGTIRSSASTTLKDLRHQLDKTERQIKTALDNVLKTQAKKLADSLVTMRYNRYVVPVKLSDKNTFKGTVLDYSSSGETVYIEPDSVRELSSKKERLEAEEKHEIERILYELTLEVKTYVHPLKANQDIFTHLDFIFAKAKYAWHIGATKPTLNDTFSYINARHPLIAQDEVVANTIQFNDGVQSMIITGSNTGGKTVTLKTVGLLSLMVQSGLLIPVSHGSTFTIFNEIRADIGDEQSIEQSLSTFSSHMKNIVNIINDVQDKSLILLDELGSGTDPTEGASLGMSILNHLSQKDVLIMATTHYPELKAYAYSKPSIMNASVEFDETTLKPTYRLLLNTPGESHALLIADRLGLNKAIIEDAKTQVLSSKSEISELIDTLRNESTRLDKMIQSYEKNISQVESEKKDVLALKRSLQKEKETLKEKMALENKRILDDLKEEALKLINDLEALKSKSFKEHELAELKYKTKQLVQEETQESSTKDHVYQPGDLVYIMKFNRYGELVEKQKNKQWLVQMGGLKSVFKEKEFEYASEQTKPKEKAPASSSPAKKHVASELDLRGLRVHEAKDELLKYLDDCLMANMPFASIIHGFGTLALRKMVKEVVKNHPNITSARDGKGNEGGQGVTIVYFE
ncbi:MAG: endonuclease MutS2 [Bacillota bacterium]